jgi:S-adenosylmethionine:tRNA ribosyltransferase-isomerase
MRVDLFDYELPEELIASRPPAERDGARLCVVGAEGPPSDRTILELPSLVAPGSLVVVNDTRVVPARLFAEKTTGGRVEIFLVEKVDGEGSVERWRALARSSKPLRSGAALTLAESPSTKVTVEALRDADGTVVVRIETGGEDVSSVVERVGHMPLPPYVKRADDALDRERYQTVFARVAGAVAAPTAGLHLSERVLEALRARDVEIATVTLHVSLGTFKPVTVADLDDHPMHAERLAVSLDVARAIERARSRRAPVVAVGTTVVRALESAADDAHEGHVRAESGETRLLIQPGYRFRVVDRLLTNFHLPKSTLLALVSAFAGRERVLAAYAHAVRERYRFFSYGDAMLLDRTSSS